MCPSEDMSPYWSAHDEWLILKLCMYVGYHDASNVSNVGGDPVIQFFFFNLVFFCFRPKTCHHIARRKLCMYVGYHDANNVSNFGGDPIKFKKKLLVYEIGLIAIREVSPPIVDEEQQYGRPYQPKHNPSSSVIKNPCAILFPALSSSGPTLSRTFCLLLTCPI